MDIHKDLIQWLRNMGYNGEIPESLIGICNNSTKFIWEDLMENVRPKQDVELIKKNIIFNRLKSKPINKQDDFTFKIQEIENYRQKSILEEKLKLLKHMIQEKKYKVEKLSQNCKIKDVSIDYLKKRINVNDERKYLLELKKEQLQTQNSYANETLNKLKNVTPVEREESDTAKEITETLQKCAEKLHHILKENQIKIAQTFKNNICKTQESKRQDQSSVAKYLSMREKEDFDEITRSCKKCIEKENIPSNSQGKHESRKRLFDVPEICIENEENSLRNCESRVEKDLTFNVINDNCFKKPQKRESLGILPDSYFCDKDNDSFLLSSCSTSPMKETDNVFSSLSNNTHKSNDSSDSVVFNLTKNKREKDKKKMISFKSDEALRKQLYNNKTLIDELESLLHRNNREFIYETLEKIIQNVKVEFSKIVSIETSIKEKDNLNEDDITKLRFIHLQTELKIVQQNNVLKVLVAKVGRKKLQILSSIKSKDDTDLQDCLDFSIRQVGLDASLTAMKKEINSSKIIDNNDNELKVLSSLILKVKNEIANKIDLINLTMEDLYKTQKFLNSTRESVLSPIWHIRMFKTETEWMNPLSECLWTEEMRVFADYPLEYQRRCAFTDSKTFYRDLCIDNYPKESKMEPEYMYMMCEILENPFSPSETILLNILKAKMKLDVLKKVNMKYSSHTCDNYNKKYSFKELEKQESYLGFAIEKLKSIMYSSNATKTLAVGDVIKNTIEIWTQMPLKEFISSSRLVEGQTYKYYQNKLNSFL